MLQCRCEQEILRETAGRGWRSHARALLKTAKQERPRGGNVRSNATSGATSTYRRIIWNCSLEDRHLGKNRLFFMRYQDDISQPL